MPQAQRRAEDSEQRNAGTILTGQQMPRRKVPKGRTMKHKSWETLRLSRRKSWPGPLAPFQGLHAALCSLSAPSRPWKLLMAPLSTMLAGFGLTSKGKSTQGLLCWRREAENEGSLGPLVAPAGHWQNCSSVLYLPQQQIPVILFYVPECFAWMLVCAPCSYLVLEEALKKCRIPWDWSYQCEPSCQRLELNPGLLEESDLSCQAL